MGARRGGGRRGGWVCSRLTTDLVSIDLKELVQGVERVYGEARGGARLASASATATPASTQQGPCRERRQVA